MRETNPWRNVCFLPRQKMLLDEVSVGTVHTGIFHEAGQILFTAFNAVIDLNCCASVLDI